MPHLRWGIFTMTKRLLDGQQVSDEITLVLSRAILPIQVAAMLGESCCGLVDGRKTLRVHGRSHRLDRIAGFIVFSGIGRIVGMAGSAGNILVTNNHLFGVEGTPRFSRQC